MGLWIVRSSHTVGTRKSKRSIAPRARIVEEREPSRHRVARMQADDRANLPAANDRVGHGIHVAAHLSAASHGYLIIRICREHMRLIEVARPPFRLAIVDVLPEGSRETGLSATPSTAEVASGVGHALGIRVRDLTLQTIGEASLQYRLQSVIRLVGSRERSDCGRQSREGRSASNFVPEGRIPRQERTGRCARWSSACTIWKQDTLRDDLGYNEVITPLAYVSDLEGC